MINPAAMMGLDNAPAYKELKEIKSGINTLFQIKLKDVQGIERENKRQREEDKRYNQDVKRVLNQDKAVMQQMGSTLGNSQAGLMAALLGGAALFGAASMLGGFDLQEFIDDVSGQLSNFLDAVLPKSEDTPVDLGDDIPLGETGSPGTDANEDVGDLSDLAPTDDPKTDKISKSLPLPKTVVVTSKAGMRGSRVHAGVDIGGAGGEPLTVSRTAKVVENRVISGYGNSVIFKDNRGEHLYAHMRALSKFKPGDTVKPGQVIGYLGNTGVSTGPHLHWEFDKRDNVVGRPRSLAEVTDPLSQFSWKMPFIGKQSGGVVGKALHMIKDHEAIASLTKGERDWVRPGMQKSTGSAKKSYSSLKDNTTIYPYRDRGSKRTPTIGWGTTYLGGMMKGTDPVTMQTPPMPKKKADQHLEKDVSQLTSHLAKTVKPWKKLSDDQKSGLISIGYNAGPNAHITKNPMFVKYGKAIQSGNIQEAVKPNVMPHYESRKDRRLDEINLLKSGPQQVTGFQSGGVVGVKKKSVPVQTGGLMNVDTSPKAPDNYQHYTPEYYERQAKNVSRSTIIIVNKRSSSGNNISAPSVKSQYSPATDEMPSYTDIAQTYYRYVGGIKI